MFVNLNSPVKLRMIRIFVKTVQNDFLWKSFGAWSLEFNYAPEHNSVET